MSEDFKSRYTRIPNEILEALAKIRISGESRQVLDVILRRTYGYNRTSDTISTTQFMEATNLPAYAIHKARAKLIRMNLITVTKKGYSTITKKGDSQVLTYEFQRDFEKWIPLPKKVTVTKKGDNYNQKRLQVSPKKVTNCNQKSVRQNKERKYIKENIYIYNSQFENFKKDKVEIPDWMPLEALNAFKEMRNKIRKPLTAKAEQLLYRNLERLRNDGEDIEEVLNQSILNCWQGVFPVKKQRKYIGNGVWKEGDKYYDKDGDELVGAFE